MSKNIGADVPVVTLKAYQRKLKRRATDGCLCECRCGHVHPDQRLRSGEKETTPVPKPS